MYRKYTWNKTTGLIFQAHKLLLITGQEITISNLARLFGNNRKAMKRLLFKNSIIIYKRHLLTVTPQSTSIVAILQAPYTGGVFLYGASNAATFSKTGEGEVSVNTYVLASVLQPCLGDNIRAIDTFTDNINLVLGSCLYYSLVKHKYFHHATGFDKGIEYSERLVRIIKTIVSSGHLCHRGNVDFKYLYEHDRKYDFIKLIEREAGYRVGVSCQRTTLTDYLTDVIFPTVIDMFLKLEFKQVRRRTGDVLVTADTMKQLNVRDIFYLFGKLRGVDKNGDYVVNYDEIDEQESRKYNTFTAIKSITRKALGYISYDMSAGLQRITFNFIDVDDYPIHKILIDDKHRLRKHLAKVLNKKVDGASGVKVMLTAIDNGSRRYKKAMKKSRVLKMYVEESKSMVTNFNAHMEDTNKTIYKRALVYAKAAYVQTNRYDKEGKPIFKKDGDRKNKFSLFFFMWTQVEREIRDVMKESFSNTYDAREVHDAIYSKEDVSVPKMEQNIFEKLGLTIKIEKEV